jgi:hypothetical protein
MKVCVMTEKEMSRVTNTQRLDTFVTCDLIPVNPHFSSSQLSVAPVTEFAGFG